MSETLRMRLLRSPQRLCRKHDEGVPLYTIDLSEFAQNVLAPAIMEVADPQDYVRGSLSTALFVANGLTEASTDLESAVHDLDCWLLRRGNLVGAKDLHLYLSQLACDSDDPVEHWLHSMAGERARLSDLLLASFFRPSTPELRGRITRLLLVIALIDRLRVAAQELEKPGDVFAALRWRTILLPPQLHALFDSFEFRRARPVRSGFCDLYLAREEWVRYEAGEIAHIENVRAGELKKRKLLRISEREETETVETESNTFSERSTESTDRFELAEEATREAQLSLSVEATVDLSASYGTLQVDSHIGGSFDYSQTESSKRATTQMRESVVRAVTRIEERVRHQQVTRTLLRTEAADVHSLKNDTTNDRVSTYRWIDKVKRVQIFRYPNRYVLEFQVPEPGAWWRWMQSRPQASRTISEKPAPFTLDGKGVTSQNKRLMPSQIDATNCQSIGARYMTIGLEPPPSRKTLSAQVTSNSDMGGQNDVVYMVDKALTVPNGYVATLWEAAVMQSTRSKPVQAPTSSVTFGVGVAPPSGTSTIASSGGYATSGMAQPKHLQGSVGPINTGTVPIAVSGYLTDSYMLNVTVHCDPTADELMRWKISTCERLAYAYAEMQRQYDEEVRASLDGVPSLADRYSPARNREIVTTELKRHVISMLSGVDFNGRNALEVLPAYQNEPRIDMDSAVRFGPEVQFLEQAFEWANLSYVLYPYFWTARDRWPDLAGMDGADPDFVRFLRAGSARVVVPARPGFEAQVQLYAKFGILWGGGPVPAPNEPGYLSVAEEIKDLQRAPADGERGESWEVWLPTSLTCLGDGSGLPTNKNVTLDPPPGRILPQGS